MDMGRISSSNTSYNCLICWKEFIGLNLLSEHLANHINFGTCLPFPCSSCGLAFKTKEERNKHCRKEGHVNTHKTNNEPYKEILLEHLLFDAEQAKRVSVEVLISIKREIFQSALTTLRSNGDKLRVCTLCAEKMKDDQSLRKHIKHHIKFRTYVCKCKKTFHSKKALGKHMLATGHQQDKDMKNVAYTQMLVNHLIMESRSSDSVDVIIDCKAEAMQRLRHRILQLPSKRTRGKKLPVSSSISPNGGSNRESMDDRDEYIQPTTSIANYGHQSFPRHPLALRTLQAEIKCISCNKMVPSYFLLRQKHVSELHMGREHSNEDYAELLEAAMEKSFPGQTYSSNQCNICGGSKCSDPRSRREHVKKKHSEQLPNIKCPVCNQDYRDITESKKHWKDAHENGLNIDSTKIKRYNDSKVRYNKELSELVAVAYPVEAADCEIPGTLPAVEPIRTRVLCTNIIGKRWADGVRSRRKSDSSESCSEMEVVDARTMVGSTTLKNIQATSHSVSCDDSSSTDDDEIITEVATPEIPLAPCPTVSTQSSNQQQVSATGHKCSAPAARCCTKRILMPEVYLISSDDLSSDGDQDEEILVLKECRRGNVSTTSSPAESSLGVRVTANIIKKSRLKNGGRTNINVSQNKSRWNQQERSCSSGEKKSDAKVRR